MPLTYVCQTWTQVYDTWWWKYYGASFLFGLWTTLCALVVYPCYLPVSLSIIKIVQSSSICVVYEHNLVVSESYRYDWRAIISSCNRSLNLCIMWPGKTDQLLRLDKSRKISLVTTVGHIVGCLKSSMHKTSPWNAGHAPG